jgi:hypothetical protein
MMFFSRCSSSAVKCTRQAFPLICNIPPLDRNVLYQGIWFNQATSQLNDSRECGFSPGCQVSAVNGGTGGEKAMENVTGPLLAFAGSPVPIIGLVWKMSAALSRARQKTACQLNLFTSYT